MICSICTADAPHVGHGFHHCGSCGSLLFGTSVTVPALVVRCREMILPDEADKGGGAAVVCRRHLKTVSAIVNPPPERTPS